MPTVAVINGIKVGFYFDEHPPPHFHARYAEFLAQIDIERLEIIEWVNEKGEEIDFGADSLRQRAEKQRELHRAAG